jgi:RHS repeat-associated protein
MQRLKLFVSCLAATLALAAPTAALPASSAASIADDQGYPSQIDNDVGTTRYRYFANGSLETMVDSRGIRYTFRAGDVPATVATASPNFLPFLAISASPPVDDSANRFIFGSLLYERELGLYLTPSGRLYDPGLGRFVQQDSYLGIDAQPPSLHRYVYTNDNPLRYVDPSGHETASAGCYWGAATCGQSVPITGVEKRALAGLVGTLQWAAKGAFGTLKLALGIGWEGFGERVVAAGDDPATAFHEAKEGLKSHVNASLDRAQEHLDRGEDFQAALGFTEEVSAPIAGAIVGTAELSVGLARAGGRVLAEGTTVAVPFNRAVPPSRPTISVSEMGGATETLVVTEDGLVPALAARPRGTQVAVAETPANEVAVASRSAPKAEVLSGSKLEHMNAAIAEEHGYAAALEQGQVGIQGPGSVTAPGPDFVTFEPRRGEIVVWDAKYRGPGGGSAPSTIPAAKLERWMPEVKAAIAALPEGPIKTAAEAAYRAGKIRGQGFKWP